MFNFLKRNKEESKIRDVYFGIRVRLLFTLSLVMVIIISVLAMIMYLNQRSLLEEEKNTKAIALTHILSGPAEFYLDKTIDMTDEALRIKYETITREATNFKDYNKDIVKIILTDQFGKILFSTDDVDYKKTSVLPYIANCLKQEKEELQIYDYSEPKKPVIKQQEKKAETKKPVKNRKTKKRELSGKGIKKKTEDKQTEDNLKVENDFPAKTEPQDINNEKEKIKKNKFRAITYPIFLHKGNVIDIVSDFNNYYQKFHDSGASDRKDIYYALWKKHSEILGDEFDPKKIKNKKQLTKEVVKEGDIDFLFLKLFGNIMIVRDRRINKSDRWLFRDNWLAIQKKNKNHAYMNDMSEQAKEINDLIISRMKVISLQVENIRKLGAIAIIFNVDKIQTELDQTINKVLIIAASILLIGLIAFTFVLNFMIKNLKKLEQWAISVSAGNLDTKIVIKTNDEIGRLSDIFNHMIDEITIKYHLEKFVSRSTRSMIGKADTADDLMLGSTDRKDLVFLFSDVRGFTTFSEKNSPETVIEILNFYLELQSKIIKSKKGDIDSYIGDEIMAHFSGDKKIDRAIDAAIDIMKAISRANADRIAKNHPIFEVGIGINGGDVVVGNIGSYFRMDFTCIGDSVNLSARLCSNAGAGEILVSKEIFDQANKKYDHIKVPPIAVKGKEKKISIVKIKI